MVIRKRMIVHFFGSIVISRCRACHSWSGYCPVGDLKKLMIVLPQPFYSRAGDHRRWRAENN